MGMILQQAQHFSFICFFSLGKCIFGRRGKKEKTKPIEVLGEPVGNLALARLLTKERIFENNKLLFLLLF